MKKHNKKCIKCNEDFIWFLEETWWDYQGLEPVKLTKCPNCGCIQTLEYEEMVNPNYDKRYYR